MSLHSGRDGPADRAGLVQAYAETQSSLLWDLEDLAPGLAKRSPRQGLSGFFALGKFFAKERSFARPDNTGSAFLRSVGHLDLTLYRRGEWTFFTGLDANVLTDRRVGNRFRPTELDLRTNVGVRWRDWEVSLIRESDRPMGRTGLIQATTR